MKLKDVRLCLDCECVYDSKINPPWQEICPDCSSKATHLIVNWLSEENAIGARVMGQGSRKEGKFAAD